MQIGPDVVSRHKRIQDILFYMLAWVHSLKPEAVWVMKCGKHDLLISLSLTRSWANLKQFIFASHPCFIIKHLYLTMLAEKRK